MKKILFAISLFFFVQTTFAQLEKGMKSVGIISGISSYKYTSDLNTSTSTSTRTTNTLNYSILPTMNYFLSNKYSIGLSIGYRGKTEKTQGNGYDTTFSTTNYRDEKQITNGIVISPNVKYYIPVNDKLYFYLNGSCIANFGNSTLSGQNTITYINQYTGLIESIDVLKPNETKSQNLSIGISPGILFMPSKKIGLEFSSGNIIAYNYSIENKTYTNSDETTKTTTNGLDFLKLNTLSLNLGLYFFF